MHNEEKDFNMLLLHVQKSGNLHVDARIFGAAALISQHFVYTSKGSLEDSSLSLLAQAAHFAGEVTLKVGSYFLNACR